MGHPALMKDCHRTPDGIHPHGTLPILISTMDAGEWRSVSEGPHRQCGGQY